MNFIFLLGKRTQEQEASLKKLVNSFWGEISTIDSLDFLLIYPKSDRETYLLNNEEILGCIDGWTAEVDRNYSRSSIQNLYKAINSTWPIDSDNFTGCFSGFCFDKKTSILRIFTDIAAVYPLYYAFKAGQSLIGTSQAIIGKFLNYEVDWTGIVEMISPPHYITLGSRTIVKDVKQLLPGELIEITSGNVLRKLYDNSLYGEPLTGSLKDQAELVWEMIKADVKASISDTDTVNLGMSGGWDSRLIAAALQGLDVHKTFYTYGLDQDEYEVQLAKKCAQLSDADFHFCNIYETYFPGYELFYNNLKNSESLFITQWMAIINNSSNDIKDLFILGDMFESIVGRNIKSLTTREIRKKRYFSINKNENLFCTSKEGFYNWSNKLAANFQINWKGLNSSLVDSLNIQTINEELLEDLKCLFKIIEMTNIPYNILYDEIYSWYTHGKSMNKQICCLKEKFFPVSSTMSVRLIKLTSKINPIDRADLKLLHEIQILPELWKYSSLPSAAIPFIPSYTPLWIKDLVWGARSTIDKRLIKHAMKKKDKKARMSVLSSTNFVTLYNHPKAKERVASYFEGSPIKADPYLQTVERRATLESWPYINTDIIGPSIAAMLFKLLTNS